MDVLLESYARLLKETVLPYQRKFYSDFAMKQRLVGVVGARGVGKTTFLLHYLRENYLDNDAGLYVSADHLYFSERTLLGVADKFSKEHDGKLLCIDEIHKYPNWSQELKNIYDFYPKLQVIFSGSSSLNLVESRYDLSRRVRLEQMYGFSFREYLEVQLGKPFPVLSFKDVIKNASRLGNQLMKIPRLLGFMKQYWQKGYYPTCVEIADVDAYWSSILNVIDKAIYEDISNIYSVKTTSLKILKKVVYFFATCQPGLLSINKLSNSLGKDHSTTAEYIQMLRNTGILRFLLVDKRGHALVRNAEKIYLDNSNLLYAINSEVGSEVFKGAVRELFVISSLENAGYSVSYSKKGDIICDDIVLEVGGRNKAGAQLKGLKDAYVVKDDVLVGGKRVIPLYLFGFLS